MWLLRGKTNRCCYGRKHVTCNMSDVGNGIVIGTVEDHSCAIRVLEDIRKFVLTENHQ